jgi:site-specific DNA-cytosine methylase
MKTLDLFSGIGGLAYAFEHQGFETAAFAEIDPFASRVLAHHWPDVPNLGDVKQITGVDIEARFGAIDVVCGGFPCFPAGTLIWTPDGVQPIEEIVVGDEVLTHQLRYRRVTKTMSRTDAPTLQVKVFGAPPIETTAEHPFWVRRHYRAWNNDKRSYERRFHAPKWVEAGDLQYWDMVATPICAPVVSPFPDWCDGTLLSDPHFWYLIGRWLGDGWLVTHKRKSEIARGSRGSRVNSQVWKVIICCSHAEEVELAEKIQLAGFHATMSRERTGVKFHISSKFLVQALGPFGRGAAGKRIPHFTMGLPRASRVALLAGYRDSDGSECPHERWEASTISPKLALGVSILSRSVSGVLPSMHYSDRRRASVIEGRLVNTNPIFTVGVSTWNKFAVKGNDGWFWTPVRRVGHGRVAERVYNLSVDEDESYVANAIAVHNCTSISAAGKGEGLGSAHAPTPTSGLWYELLRIVREVRPRWALVENVPALRTRGSDVVLAGLEDAGYAGWPTVVGAWAVDAPHRRDRVWILAVRRDVADACGHALRELEQRSAAPRWGDPVGERGEAAENCGQALARGSGEDDVGNGDGHERFRVRNPGSAERVEEALGPDPDRRSGPWLDRAWPARPGECQYGWEPARVVGDPDFSNSYGWHTAGLEEQARLEAGSQDRASVGKTSELTVGGDPDGLPDGLARRPRLGVRPGTRRREQLKAIGNSVVPHVVEPYAAYIAAMENLIDAARARVNDSQQPTEEEQ